MKANNSIACRGIDVLASDRKGAMELIHGIMQRLHAFLADAPQSSVTP
ncbi:MAG: hypothetical protein V4710_12065 [Verrucomicrobiota bacterium]